ncbi:hypothetical protein [Mycolicibacterium gadium]|uniref:hypothetical protein n=1 Tax=Mycolicibacterium gadium TaxID=1794 RepID=UPI001E0BD52E|nr:hypothetical protein [Mycobacteriaceae bacterium]
MRSVLGRRVAAIAGGAAVTAMVVLTASCSSDEEAPSETTETTTSETTTTTSAAPVEPTEKAPRLEPGGPNPFSPSVIAPPAPSATHPRTG